MSNEWKELKIDNLPSDILMWEIGKTHMIERKIHGKWEVTRNEAILSVLGDLQFWSYRYCKPESLLPTHEDIMTLWWRVTETSWKKVDTYNSNSQDGPVYIFNSSADGSTKIERFDRYFALKEWFTNRESAIVPPEAK